MNKGGDRMKNVNKTKFTVDKTLPGEPVNTPISSFIMTEPLMKI